MLRTSMLTVMAALCAAGAAQAQNADSAAGFTPGPHNDANTCSDLWKGVGLPEYAREQGRDTIIVCHSRYVLSHNNEGKTPDWVLERLTREQVSGDNTRPKMKFQPEPFVPEDKRAVDDDYKNSKFDRGHQAPSGDFTEKREWMVESFFLSNIVPQIGVGFNQGIWKNLEDHVRDLVRRRGELYVVTGPVYPDEIGEAEVTISDTNNVCRKTIVLDPLPRKSICGSKMTGCVNGVTVPVALFKMIYDPHLRRANAFIMPNINHRDASGFSDPFEYIKKFQVSVQVVEKFTGLEFFSALAPVVRKQVVMQCAAPMSH